MNELQRMAYLDALGIDGYVSKLQLPGAAQTRRLVVVRAQASSDAPRSHAEPEKNESTNIRSPLSAMLRQETPAPSAIKNTDAPQQVERPAASSALQFQLAVIIAGQYLWVEELGDMPLRSEQVWLIEAMAQALQLVSGAAADFSAPRTEAVEEKGTAHKSKAEVIYFNWPLHNNPQLESGEEAARASLTGFVERKCQEYACRGVVLLGEDCSRWLPQVPAPLKSVLLHNSAHLLADSSLKRESWKRLLAIKGAD